MASLADLLLKERDLLNISQVELVERLAICRHLPEFEFYYQKYANRIHADQSRILYLQPTALFYQVRNYAFYLLMQEKDERDRFRICMDYVSMQRSHEMLGIEELELLRLSLAFVLRQHDHPYLVWTAACEIFLREPYEEDSRDYHTMLVNGAPEQATSQQRNRLLAWGEINPDKLLDIVTILRKHHKTLGKKRLEEIEAFILAKCSELDTLSDKGGTKHGGKEETQKGTVSV